jgi:N-acetylglucosamine-6-phosphate deacetylase
MQIPGFIDLQVNGYKDVDFSSGQLTKKQCEYACRELLKTGTAGFLVTVVTSSEDIYKRNFEIISEVIEDKEFQNKLLGIHAEGPFISGTSGAVGAHNPEWVKKPSIEFFEKMQTWANGNIKMATIAAELEGSEQLTRYLREKNIAVSLGHQMAGYDDLKRLYKAGAGSVTHLGNGMPNQVPRHNNQILAALAVKNLKALIITDGHHLPEQVIRAVINAKGIDNVIVTSDAAPLAGMKPGKYNVLGNDAVLEENGLLHNPEKQCMVGSSATMLECINHLAGLNILNSEELLNVGFYNPLELIGIKPDLIESENKVVWNNKKRKFEIEQRS